MAGKDRGRDGDSPDGDAAYEWLYGSAGDSQDTSDRTRMLRLPPHPEPPKPRQSATSKPSTPPPLPPSLSPRRTSKPASPRPGAASAANRTRPTSSTAPATTPRPSATKPAAPTQPIPRPAQPTSKAPARTTAVPRTAPGGPTQPPRTPPPSPQPSAPGGSRWAGKGPLIRRGLLALVAIWVVFLIATPLVAWQGVNRVDAEPSGNRPGEQPGTTYLLVGSDSREGLTKRQRRALATGNDAGRRTDTIMLLHTGSGPNLLMSIPRDSLLEVPGYGVTKVNAAYSYGGPRLLVRTLEDATGIRIDNYIEIGFGGFVKIINAVGGITICPKARLVDPLAGLKVQKGCQEAGGRKALAYARTRKTQQLGDIDRAANQREVVGQVGSKATSPWSVLNPWRYYRLSHAGVDAVRVGDNVGMFTMAKFALAMRSIGGEGSLTCGVPIANLNVQWDAERSERMFALIRADKTDQIRAGLCSKSGLPG